MNGIQVNGSQYIKRGDPGLWPFDISVSEFIKLKRRMRLEKK